jgi:hypothetical protein
MKTAGYDEQRLLELFMRYGVPALAWAAVFAFFAFSGLVSHDDTAQLVTLTSSRANVSESSPASAPARDPAPRDPAVAAHEALDPVGVGLNSNTTR